MITAERLRNLLSYDRKTGLFRWRVRLSNRVNVDDIAGSDHVGGARKISVLGVSYLAHRLAVLHVLGRWPEHSVTFRNGKRADSRWRNLLFA
jgi:HNH endonuclease